jgi:hypothetical protein
MGAHGLICQIYWSLKKQNHLQMSMNSTTRSCINDRSIHQSLSLACLVRPVKSIAAIFTLFWLGLGVMDASISPGDIAFLQINDSGATTGCLVKWAPLVDIPSGTAITFSDRSWINGATLFGTLTSEGEVTFTAPSTIAAGTIFTFTLSAPATVSLTRDSDSASFNSSLVVSGWTGTLILTSAGDNFFAFTGADTSPNFIFGTVFTTITTNRDLATGWSTNTVAATTSILPPGLTSGVDGMSLDYTPSAPHYMAYNGLTTVANRATWLARIVNPASWSAAGSVVTGSFGTTLPFPTAARFHHQYPG